MALECQQHVLIVEKLNSDNLPAEDKVPLFIETDTCKTPSDQCSGTLQVLLSIP